MLGVHACELLQNAALLPLKTSLSNHQRQQNLFTHPQFVISNGRGGRRYAPYAFTEQGVAMLQRSAKQASRARERGDHASVCQTARDLGG